MNSAATKPDEQLQSQPAPASPSSLKQNLAFSLILVVITTALYLRVNGFPFVNYDDTIYVTQNTVVQDGVTWNTVRWSFTTYRVGTWHPLTWLSHALDCQLFDLDPAGPHDVNVLLHVLNVVLLFWVLQRATGLSGRSFMVAALFALHPINVESVVWIAERKNSLSMLFFLLALGAYRWYVADRKPGRYLAVAVLFALGLMAKPQVITFPFVLLLWDYWPLQRMTFGTNAPLANGGRERGTQIQMSFSQLVWEKLPLFVLSGISAFLTMSAQRADGNKIAYPLGLRLEFALVSYVQYIGKALWPVRLSPFYPHPDFVPVWQAIAALLFLALVTVGTIVLRRSRPYLLVGWLFFLGTLVPMLGFAGVGYQGKQGIADRYAYLPFIGLFIMICWAVAEWAQQKHLPTALLRAVSAAVLLALGLIAYRQLGYWRDNVTLWSHALAVTDGNFLAENNLGKALLADGRTEEGVAHFYKAVAIYPDDPVGNMNIGLYEQKRGSLFAAIERYKKTVSLTRDPELKAGAYSNMAACYRQLGDAGAAQQSQDEAARLQR
ncbi:MAG: tetratricopeptide repeat protein [Candidatus Korobacteraceae bacterium]